MYYTKYDSNMPINTRYSNLLRTKYPIDYIVMYPVPWTVVNATSAAGSHSYCPKFQCFLLNIIRLANYRDNSYLRTGFYKLQMDE